MVLCYDFGDDYTEDYFEFEINSAQVIEAVADYVAESYINRIIRKHKPSIDECNRLINCKKVLCAAYRFLLSDLDLEDELIANEDLMDDVVKDYFKDQAYKEWQESKE